MRQLGGGKGCLYENATNYDPINTDGSSCMFDGAGGSDA